MVKGLPEVTGGDQRSGQDTWTADSRLEGRRSRVRGARI